MAPENQNLSKQNLPVVPVNPAPIPVKPKAVVGHYDPIRYLNPTHIFVTRPKRTRLAV